jgi:Cytochrome P460
MRRILSWLSLLTTLAIAPAMAAELCPSLQTTPQVPSKEDLKTCADLDPIVRKPNGTDLKSYETALTTWLQKFCHRREDLGWTRDKTVRDTGPYIATLGNGKWSGANYGTHAPVVIWYSPDMIAWLKTNRGENPANPPAPIPDGAIMIKEIYESPASRCRDNDPLMLKPGNGIALMVRDSTAAHDGWFWGYFGWGQNQNTDWPPRPGNTLPYMGFGQYCMNCHASAHDNLTFASLTNIKDQPGHPIDFLSMDFFQQASNQDHVPPAEKDHHAAAAMAAAIAAALPNVVHQSAPTQPNRAAYMTALGLPHFAMPTDIASITMPSATYDNVWVSAAGPNPHAMFLTSDQCLGCHSAGTTGLRYDMTEPTPQGTLLNFSPYGAWRYTPMGLAGRDPVFFAQLASETQTFHDTISPTVQDTCLGCHGMMGQRQFGIDNQCQPFSRAQVDAVPFPTGASAKDAPFGALSREGVSCLTCHRIAIGAQNENPVRDESWNKCGLQRQAELNPDNTGFARTFTGSFLLGRPDRINGPFTDPKTVPMVHALGNTPVHNPAIESFEACGSCHTVHLPIMRGTDLLGRTYEQTTYAEWAFSAYRVGSTPDGPLPQGAGSRAQDCQGCHMPEQAGHGTDDAYRSKIASIEEVTGFPQAEHTAAREDVDLPYRTGFAKHLLVGLNYFLVQSAKQFSDVLGLPNVDQMLFDMAPDPTLVTRQSIEHQASSETADIAVEKIAVTNGVLNATVRVTNKTGHKFPSGVSFRRAFITFDVRDAAGHVLWSSGRSNDAGLLVDETGKPIPGELWWKPDCTARLDPDKRVHQPHYLTIDQQNQAQIFEELVTAPPPTGPAHCGWDAEPSGALTTSFLSICAKLKDNRILPDGFLPLQQRTAIATALGAHNDLAEDAGPKGVGTAPGYDTGGFSSVIYRVKLDGLKAKPASVTATLSFQATPPYFLQDRFCTAKGADTNRLAYIASGLDVTKTPIAGWKLNMVSTGPVRVP